MAHFTVQVSPGGPLINAVVRPSKQRSDALKAAGKPVPADVALRALVDTGASSTCVDPSVLTTQLGLSPTGVVPVHTPSSGQTPHQADQYDIGLIIYGTTTAQFLEFPTIPVLSCDLSQQGIQALLGRDIIGRCVLVYNGALGQFTMAF